MRKKEEAWCGNLNLYHIPCDCTHDIINMTWLIEGAFLLATLASNKQRLMAEAKNKYFGNVNSN